MVKSGIGLFVNVSISFLVFAFISFSLVSVNVSAAGNGRFFDVEAYPLTLDAACREGVAKLYDECGSQVDIVNAAMTAAAAKDKTVLVVYGAEWCVWCFVFDSYIQGEYREHYYEWARDQELEKWVMTQKSNEGAKPDARRLNQFVAENFVIAHIEGDKAPDGADAINALGLNASDINFYPFIASLSKTGAYAGHMFGYEVMKNSEDRKDREGRKLKSFDRTLLLERLNQLKNQAN